MDGGILTASRRGHIGADGAGCHDGRDVHRDNPRLCLTIKHIGGNTGWRFGNWLWRVRGFIDLWAEDDGLRRPRRNPSDLSVGYAVDWWRAEK
jgi:hypothetical protein